MIDMHAAAREAEDLFSPPEPIAASASGYVLCGFAGIQLAISQRDVLAIEHVSELAAPLPGEAVVGWYESTQGPWPAYALDARLQPLTLPPPSSAFLIFLQSDPWPSGLLCESVRILRNEDELRIVPLPAVMKDPYVPIRAIARTSREQIALVCTEGALASYLTIQTGDFPDG